MFLLLFAYRLVFCFIECWFRLNFGCGGWFGCLEWFNLFWCLFSCVFVGLAGVAAVLVV